MPLISLTKWVLCLLYLAAMILNFVSGTSCGGYLPITFCFLFQYLMFVSRLFLTLRCDKISLRRKGGKYWKFVLYVVIKKNPFFLCKIDLVMSLLSFVPHFSVFKQVWPSSRDRFRWWSRDLNIAIICGAPWRELTARYPFNLKLSSFHF